METTIGEWRLSAQYAELGRQIDTRTQTTGANSRDGKVKELAGLVATGEIGIQDAAASLRAWEVETGNTTDGDPTGELMDAVITALGG